MAIVTQRTCRLEVVRRDGSRIPAKEVGVVEDEDGLFSVATGTGETIPVDDVASIVPLIGVRRFEMTFVEPEGERMIFNFRAVELSPDSPVKEQPDDEG